MATYVLVHGGWVGGWAWRRVAELLRAADHRVHTPTLTGLGERVHLAGPDVDLDTHITDIVNLIRYEALDEVILVGWSYGGMVITGVADRVAERLAHVVYLDALLPEDGEAEVDVDTSYARDDLEAMLAQGTLAVPHPDPEAPRRTDMPIAPCLQPIRLTNPTRGAVPGTYIHCLDKPEDSTLLRSTRRAAARAQAKGWRVVELDADHCPLWTMPETVSELLLSVADG